MPAKNDDRLPMPQRTARRTQTSSRTTLIYEQIRADILACRLRPGQRLNIGELSQSLGVNLGAVREALSRLTSEALVVAEPQRGFAVASISAADLTDLTRVRIDIETQCLRRSLQVGGLDWETRLVAAHHALSRTPAAVKGDPSRVADTWATLHDAFHEVLVSVCDSPWLLRIRRSLFAQSERYRRLSLPLAKQPRRVDQEHAALLEAALAREIDQAEDIMRRHLTKTTETLLRLSVVEDGHGDLRRAPSRGAHAVANPAPKRLQRKHSRTASRNTK